MTTPSRRTVLTGFGVISPIGSGPAAFWSALAAGTSGVRTITRIDPFALPSKMAGEVRDFSAKSLIEKSYRRTLNAMARTVEFGAIGCQFAMQDAGLAKGTVPPERIGIDFASVMGATELDDLGPASKRSLKPDQSGPDMATWGAVGLPEFDNAPPEKRPEKGLLGIRKALGVYANLRPVRAYASQLNSSPLKNHLV
jgi:3-oxoacyl-[acyl-carrier-protein] synthase II